MKEADPAHRRPPRLLLVSYGRAGDQTTHTPPEPSPRTTSVSHLPPTSPSARLHTWSTPGRRLSPSPRLHSLDYGLRRPTHLPRPAHHPSADRPRQLRLLRPSHRLSKVRVRATVPRHHRQEDSV
ncbi:uncharacterized protein LOC135109114 isoform X1 [Scylla paramamosain]|uniref:uncharacterized protein LOC135109114 isoform X1 n=1 Tax=Scylla paramamosain TaxID=85552 RepID=UPI003082B2B5